MPLPPGARPLNVAEVRRQFAAGTLGTVGDDAGREHVERDGVAPNPNGAYGDAMGHADSIRPDESTRARTDWDGLLARVPSPRRHLRGATFDALAVEAESVRQARLKLWQEPRV